MSGSASERVTVDTAKARNLPALTYSSDDAMSAKVTAPVRADEIDQCEDINALLTNLPKARAAPG
jgi:hypothetical protein